MTCPVPTEFKKFLLYARQMEIRGVDLDAPYYNYIISFTVPDIDNVTVLDYDAREQRVYWSDVRTQAIKRAFINGTGVETVVSAGSVLALGPLLGMGTPQPRPRSQPWSQPHSLVPLVLMFLLQILFPLWLQSWFRDPCSPRNQSGPSLRAS